MSLTNPNKVVTEERLSEFYQAILPYLGGMPEAIANKFSSADLYSTSEKIVGCWTDGRPVYQKTIESTMPTISTFGTAVEKTIDIGASVLEIADVKGYLVNTNGSGARVPFPHYSWSSSKLGQSVLTVRPNSYTSTPKNVLAIVSSENTYSDCPIVITLQYTKTTDSANSFNFSTETDYSTTEHIIGTWIDGKPIYQKTINCGALPSSSGVKTISTGISNVKLVLSAKGIAYATNDMENTQLMIPTVNPIDGSKGIGVNADATKIYIRVGSNRSSFTESYITIQYTKTTD